MRRQKFVRRTKHSSLITHPMLSAIYLMHHVALVFSILSRASPLMRSMESSYHPDTPYTKIVGNCEFNSLNNERCGKGGLRGSNLTSIIASHSNNETDQGIYETTELTSPAAIVEDMISSENTKESSYASFPNGGKNPFPLTLKSVMGVTGFLRNFLVPNNNGDSSSFNSKTTTRGLDLRVPFREHLSRGRMNTVYPGTVWCGVGNFAPNNASFGLFFITDQCCKKHDQCPDSIPARGTRHGLRNTGLFSRSHCDCDREFYLCLKNAKTIVSHKIGVGYFNILRPQCYRQEYPIIDCLSWFDKKCVTYLVDETKAKKWQWFDNRNF